MTDVVWQSVLGEIEVSVSRASFATWFKNTALLHNQDGAVTIGVPNIFIKRQFEAKFHSLIMKTLKRNGVPVKEVRYKIRATANDIQPVPSTSIASPGEASVPTAAPTISINSPTRQSHLNPRYTFENFVVGSGSELAYTAAQAIAREPGTKYNPLFVYGGVGLGKTHLIQAIGNELIARKPTTKVEYVTCERFFKEFISSVLSKRPFTNRYRDADVLIVDDMQFIAGKERAQEEFFFIFNALHEANKQIVISSDKPPSAIPTLEERLRSRFEMGMSVDIQAPDFETRVAIIQAKVNRANKTLPADVLEFIATHVQSNIRELEGVLNKLFAHCEMRGLVPSMDLVEQMINPPAMKYKNVSPTQIVDKTARFFNLTQSEICGPKRDKGIVEPRQIAMYLMRSELKLSYPQIAKHLGRSDHTTAIHSINKIEQAVLNNHYLRSKIFELKEKLYA
jgi:chromosomal replication initiator protein